MDVIGCVASVSQLVCYSHSATQRLINLYQAVQGGPAFCRDESQNIRYLLRAVKRICSIKAPDLDALLPLCISIADRALTLLNLLGPTEALRSRWLWMAKSRDIQSLFRSLRDKANILHLYFTEKTFFLIRDMSAGVTSPEQTDGMQLPSEDHSVCTRYNLTDLESQ